MRAPRSRRAQGTSAATTSAADPDSLERRFEKSLTQLGFDGGPAALGLSGGGDSVALMRLMARLAKTKRFLPPTCLIVDHGLRDGSSKEASLVAGWARAAGLDAHVLRSTAARPSANIEEKARAARYALMGAWCVKHGMPALFVAHTLDDQAETFLLRLGRGSGVDGLSAMRPRARFPVAGFPGLTVMRPLLSFRRAELRDYLTANGVSWLEDPMNADPRFARTRIRHVLPALEAAGVPASRIGQAAGHLARARAALEAQTEAFLATHARFDADGKAWLDTKALARLPRETGLRALSAILIRIAGAAYRPRFERLENLFDALTLGNLGKARTLHSCRIGTAPKLQAAFGPGTVEIARERPRTSSLKPAESASAVAPGARPSRSKSPQKGRNIAASYNS